MNEKMFCIQCKQYFKNKEDWDKEHEKIFYKAKNIKHNFLYEGNTLSYIYDMMTKNYESELRINKLNNEIVKITNKLNFFEDAFKNDVFFETNVNVKNIENKIFGKCLIHFFPKSVNFRIECIGDINFNGRKELEIEILFPFKTSKFKFCSIEKLKGCLSSKIVKNSSDEETMIFSNYSSIVNQNNKVISIKLLRNYYIIESLKKNSIEILLNGTLTFSDYGINFNEPFVLYNIIQKTFLAYDKYQWKFFENCFSEEGTIKNECIINIELNLEVGEIYIKNKNKYLGNNNNFLANNKDDAKFRFQFLNSFYGIIAIYSGNKYLNSDANTGLVVLSEETNYFMLINI